MKRIFFSLCLVAVVCMLSGCGDASRLDLSRGYGDGLKLLHLSASSGASFQRIQAFARVLEEAEPLDKDASLFGYYPDYVLEIDMQGAGKQSAVVDVNGEYVDFYFSQDSTALYRSQVGAEEFLELVHQG